MLDDSACNIFVFLCKGFLRWNSKQIDSLAVRIRVQSTSGFPLSFKIQNASLNALWGVFDVYWFRYCQYCSLEILLEGSYRDKRAISGIASTTQNYLFVLSVLQVVILYRRCTCDSCSYDPVSITTVKFVTV